MNKIQRARLLKLADFLSTMPKERFDFSIIADERGLPMLEALKAGHKQCGTVGCAIGWMPAVFPRLVTYKYGEFASYPSTVLRKNQDIRDFRAAQEVFGLTEEEAGYLFDPYGGMVKDGKYHRNPCHESATPKRVAEHIRKFVKWKDGGK